MKIFALGILVFIWIAVVCVTASYIDQPEPNYEYHYSVHSEETGDIKDQFEHRNGDYVVGRYSLIDPDGYRRIVEYSSEPLLGFTAQVRREPLVYRRAHYK